MAPQTFAVVDRPGTNREALMLALIETVVTGKAISVPLDGKTVAGVRHSLYNPLKRRGYKLRLVRDGAGWARGWVEVRRRTGKRT